MDENSKGEISLIADIRELILSARKRAAVAVNSEAVLLYWKIGCRIKHDMLKNKRAEYGQQLVVGLARRISDEFGRSWSEKTLRHCLRSAETFSEEQIVSAAQRQLSWTHFFALKGRLNIAQGRA